MVLPLLCVALITVAEAPVTSVTVYSDSARVTRTAAIPATERVEFPLLPATADPDSIRVETNGAALQRVEVQRVPANSLPEGEAQKLIRAIDSVDLKLEQTAARERAHVSVLATLQRLQAKRVKPPVERTEAKLSSNGWSGALAFIDARAAMLQQKVRELRANTKVLLYERSELIEKAKLLGAQRGRPGTRVTATVGKGEGRLTLSYRVTQAHWRPVYELQLQPDTGKVLVSLSGEVSQESGEDWSNANLVLSTAVPSGLPLPPRLLSWKIGARERFIPTPVARTETPKPAPAVPASDVRLDPSNLLVAQLGRRESAPQLARAYDSESVLEAEEEDEPEQDEPEQDEPEQDEDGLSGHGGYGAAGVQGSLRGGVVGGAVGGVLAAPAPPPKPPNGPKSRALARPVTQAAQEISAESLEEVVVSGKTGILSNLLARKPIVSESLPLSPPRGYVPPKLAADLPASLAQGHDLRFEALRKESVKSGGGARRVALLTESWPVSVERKLYPALAKDAFLVAQIKSPSSRVLPGGKAELFVGADPSGSAQLELIAPGEPFTLPLGLDRALQPVRNVKQVTAEKGFIGKDEITEYEVTIDVANPYATAIPVRIFDQWPVAGGSDVEVKLIKSEPLAVQSADKGQLEWQLSLAPRAKHTVKFTYSIRRPKGWRMSQSQ